MRFHVLWRKIKFYWKRRLVRAAAAALVLAGAIFAQYKLANIPLPVELENSKKVTIPSVKFGQELVVEGPSLDASAVSLLSHDGKPIEIINAYMDNARLSEATMREHGIAPRSSSISGPITYTTRGGEQGRTPDYNRACSTSIGVGLMTDKKLPSKISFFQTSASGNDNYRHLEIKASDAELAVRISTNPPEAPPDDVEDEEIQEDDGPGCLKRIEGDGWKQELIGGLPVQSVVAANSKFYFRFLPMTRNSPLWTGTDGLFEPFKFGGPLGLQARSLSITTPNGPPVLEVRSADEKLPLRISNLKVGSDQLQISMSGKGFVRIDGEDITVDLFERIKKYPLLAGFLAMANAALLAWLTRLGRGLFRSQS